jgi:hypothetical protein
MRSVVARPGHREISADAVRQAVLSIADCRSLTALRDALFSHADAMIGAVAMGLYMFDRAEELRYVSSRLAPQGFLDEYEREYRKADTMLDCIVSQRRTVDGFHFHGDGGTAATTKSCADGDSITIWAARSSSMAAPPARFLLLPPTTSTHSKRFTSNASI